MSNIFYSPKNTAFYPEELKERYESGGGWPDDLVQATPEEISEFMNSAPEGKTLGSDKDGRPSWVDLPPPTAEEIKRDADAKKADFLAYAATAMSPLQDAVDLGMATEDEESLLLAWKKYRVLVNRVDTSNPPIKWPEQPQ